MKRFLLIITILFLTIGMGFAEEVSIGISKIVAHPALDAIEKGIIDVVTTKYPGASFDLQNANGEISTASSIAQKFKADKVDMAIGIATPTAQALAQVIKDAPVLFSAVTDPVDAGLVSSLSAGDGNITGVSDMTPVKDQIKLLLRLKDIKKLGHVYSSSEANAVRLAEICEEACEELGIVFVPQTVSNSAEVKQAAQAIIRRVDALYVSTDNTVVSAMSALSDVAFKAKKPILSADPTSAEETEVLVAWGFNYYKMGRATGRMALDILGGTEPVSVPTLFMTSAEDIDLLINLDVAKKLKITVPQDLIDSASTLVRDGQVVQQ